MHWHSEFEINFVREGFAEFNCGDEKFVSSAGDIIVIQPNVMHSVYPCPDAHQVYDTLVFSHEIFGRSETDRYINECIKPLMNGSMRIPMHITGSASLLSRTGNDDGEHLCLRQRGWRHSWIC